MNAPFFKFGWFGDEIGLIIAFIIGLGFGFVLERAGFGSARKLAAQFYFTDMAVLKVMFSAIVTAMLGVFYLSWIGWLDVSLIYFTPTHLLPQIVGGLLLGVGFVIGGYCPGTSCVAAATGRIDGMVFILGAIFGIFLFGEMFSSIKEFYQSGSLGRLPLYQAWDVSYGVLVLAVVAMAISAFIAAEWGERKMAGR